MKPFTTVTGAAAPLGRVDVDTDQIIPKQFLKRIEKTGYGEFLFYDWRYREDNSPNPTFVLNQEAYADAPILLAGRNFGCGSSREHAAWALFDYGIRVVIAPSFADIFRNNCFQNGMLPVVLPEAQVAQLIERAESEPGYELTVDLENQVVQDDGGFEVSFEVDPFRRDCLIRGLDDIGITLQHADEIAAFERARGDAA